MDRQKKTTIETIVAALDMPNRMASWVLKTAFAAAVLGGMAGGGVWVGYKLDDSFNRTAYNETALNLTRRSVGTCADEPVSPRATRLYNTVAADIHAYNRTLRLTSGALADMAALDRAGLALYPRLVDATLARLGNKAITTLDVTGLFSDALRGKGVKGDVVAVVDNRFGKTPVLAYARLDDAVVAAVQSGLVDGRVPAGLLAVVNDPAGRRYTLQTVPDGDAVSVSGGAGQVDIGAQPLCHDPQSLADRVRDKADDAKDRVKGTWGTIKDRLHKKPESAPVAP